MSNNEINPLWHLPESLSLQEAVALTAGYDPSDIEKYRYDSDFNDKFPDYYPVHKAISNAIRSSVLKAVIVYLDIQVYSEFYEEDELPYAACELNDEKTTVTVADLRNWLELRGLKSGFFSPQVAETPDYLDPSHSCYAPKLAGAIRAWQAVVSDSRYQKNGKSVKANIENWLIAHASEFKLLKKDGELNRTAIVEQISKIVNWDDHGGAPTTPTKRNSHTR